MQKQKAISFFTVWCLTLNLIFSMFVSRVYAVDKKEVTLNFIGGTVKSDSVYYGDDNEENPTAKLDLVTKNSDASESFSKCAVSGNNMTIDLNEKDYYLCIKHIMDIEGSQPSQVLFNRLYINQTSYDVSTNNYVKLDSMEFIGNLNIRLEKDYPPSPTPSYPDDIEIRGLCDDSSMEVFFNGVRVSDKESSIISGNAKGYATGDINNLIKIQLAFGDGNIGSIAVNDQDINLPADTKDVAEFTVKPSSFYNILVKKSRDNSSVPRTIIWDSDKSNNSDLNEDELLKNGTIEILAITDPQGNPMDLKNQNIIKQDTIKNSGWANIIPGSKVILRLKPDYGYQLTSIKINDENLLARDEQSTFEYIMPNVNVHLSGIFQKVEDKVVSQSNKVKEGEIQISSEEINSGSVVLSIDDVNLLEKQISNFKEKANGYEILSCLNIHLDQVLYKGTPDNVWSNQLNDLNNEATITLKLEENIKGNQIVMVHEKSDGTYEIIPTSYDPSSNTITFKTSSFSNYALAVKTGKYEDSSIPQTGDNIIKYAIIFALALLGLAVFIVISKKNKQKNKEDL